MTVDTDDGVTANMARHFGHGCFNFVGQRAAVGVAQHQMGRTIHHCCFEHTQGELFVVLEAIKEVLEVNHHHAAVAIEKFHRVGHHCHAFNERGLQGRFDVVIPALGHNAHRLGFGVDQVTQRGIVVNLAGWATRAAKSHQHRRGQLQFSLGAGKKLFVFGVGTRPAAFDVMHA